MCLLWRSMTWNYVYSVDPRKRTVESSCKIVWIVIHININKLTKIYKKCRCHNIIMIGLMFLPDDMCLLWRSMIWNYLVLCRFDFSKTKSTILLKIVWIVIHINTNKLTKIYNKIFFHNIIMMPSFISQMCILWRFMIWNYAYFVDPISRKREVL